MSMKKRDRKPAPPKDLVKTIYHIKHHELQIKEAEVLNEGYRLYEWYFNHGYYVNSNEEFVEIYIDNMK